MADSEARKSYPKIPANNWWELRRRFRQSVPKGISADYLMSALNLSSDKAAANVLGPLKAIGLIDDNNALTDRAHDWRQDDTYPAVCRAIMDEVYPEALTSVYPPPDPDADGVKRWFARNAGVGDGAASQMAAFYRLLSEADPTGGERSARRQPSATTAKPRPAAKAAKAAKAAAATPPKPAAAAAAAAATPPATPDPPANGVKLGPMGGITVNIELQIPATADAKFFDQFFSSMRKHLLDEND